jgi:aminopeptidase N
MGTVFLHQLKYIIGEENFYKGMRLYFNTWKVRHPEPHDFIRVMEKVSGLQLKWYLMYWVNTTKKIDYGVKNVLETDGTTFVTLERVGELPMPVDLVVTYKDGSRELYYIPLNETMGSKPDEKTLPRKDLDAWPWVNPTYTLKIDRKAADITSLEIDPSARLADVERKNNVVDLSQGLKAYKNTTR